MTKLIEMNNTTKIVIFSGAIRVIHTKRIIAMNNLTQIMICQDLKQLTTQQK